MSKSRAVTRLTVVAMLGLVVACSSGNRTVPTSSDVAQAHASHARVTNGELTADQKQAIAAVRNATNKFHDFEWATSANGGGYTQQFPAGCAAIATGAQGVHYLNPSLAADPAIDLLRPELLMYEPGPNGQMKFVGVDYVTPLPNPPGTPPQLLGVDFAPLGAPLNVWALHIWAWRPNPDGMFAMWNPNVSCANYTP